MNTATQTAVAVGEQMLPELLAAAAAVNPKMAVAAPVLLDVMRAAVVIGRAAGLTPDQLQALFADVSAGIQATHDQWAALNAKG